MSAWALHVRELAEGILAADRVGEATRAGTALLRSVLEDHGLSDELQARGIGRVQAGEPFPTTELVRALHLTGREAASSEWLDQHAAELGRLRGLFAKSSDHWDVVPATILAD